MDISIDSNGRYKFKFNTTEETLLVCDRLNRRYRLEDKDGLLRFPFWSIADERKFAITIKGISLSEFINVISFEFPEIEINNTTNPDLNISYKLIKKPIFNTV